MNETEAEQIVAHGLLRPFEQDGKWGVHTLTPIIGLDTAWFESELVARAYVTRYIALRRKLEHAVFFGTDDD